MKTEYLQFPNQGLSERGISPALLPQSPKRCLITTEGGQEVPLTLAGYRLQFGSRYQVRVAEPVKEVRLVGFPSHLVRRQQGNVNDPADSPVAVKHGARYRYIPISVGPGKLLEKLTHHGVYPRQLEIEVTLVEGRRVTIVLPAVIQLGFTWKLTLLLIAWALISFLWDLSVSVIMQRDIDLTSPWPWVGGFLLAALYPVTKIGQRFLELRRRKEELRQEFADRWGNARPVD